MHATFRSSIIISVKASGFVNWRAETEAAAAKAAYYFFGRKLGLVVRMSPLVINSIRGANFSDLRG